MRAPILVLAKPDFGQLRLLQSLPGDVPVHVVEEPQVADAALLAEIEAVLYCRWGPAASHLNFLLQSCKKLRWVHIFSTGVDTLPLDSFQRAGVTLTNARGAYAGPLAEFVIGACLYFAKDFPRLLHNKQQKKWEQFESELLYGKTLGIFGYGAIGKRIAAAAASLGMQVVACRRHPERSPADSSLSAIYPPSELVTLAAQSDYFVISTPLTAETRSAVDYAILTAMKPTSVVINVGRGAVICEEDLVRALEEGAIRGAALDVFAVEPLPATSMLWDFPQVLISPHSADRYDGWLAEPVQMFIRNYSHFCRGEALEHEVSLTLGY